MACNGDNSFFQDAFNVWITWHSRKNHYQLLIIISSCTQHIIMMLKFQKYFSVSFTISQFKRDYYLNRLCILREERRNLCEKLMQSGMDGYPYPSSLCIVSFKKKNWRRIGPLFLCLVKVGYFLLIASVQQSSIHYFAIGNVP